MGDRFYTQQKNYKPKRVLKKDIIAEFEEFAGQEILGLDRMTILHIELLLKFVKALKRETEKNNEH